MLRLERDMKLKHVKYDTVLNDWNLEAIDEIQESLKGVILKGVAEVVDYVLKEGEASAYFPFEWVTSDGIGGKQPDDPLTFYVQLPFGDIDEQPTFEFSLSAEILDSIGSHVSPRSGKVEDDEGIATLSKMSAALRELADKIDASLAT